MTKSAIAVPAGVGRAQDQSRHERCLSHVLQQRGLGKPGWSLPTTTLTKMQQYANGPCFKEQLDRHQVLIFKHLH